MWVRGMRISKNLRWEDLCMNRKECLLTSQALDQSWNRSGSPAPVWSDRTRTDEKFIRPDETGFLPVHPAERNRISAGFLSVWRQKWTGRILPDFCRFDVTNEPARFLPFWRQKWTGRISTGPDRMEKTSPVPTLRWIIWKNECFDTQESNSSQMKVEHEWRCAGPDFFIVPIPVVVRLNLI